MSTINAINSNIPIEISKGGTNATSMATTDGVIYYDGTRLVTTGVGTSGQILMSNGSGSAPAFATLANPSGTVIGQSRSTSKSTTSTTTVITSSSTTPTTANTTSLDSITYTPGNNANVLIFEWTASVGTALALADQTVVFALFQGSTLQCCWAGLCGATNDLSTVTGRYQKAAGTTSSTTYTIRYFLYVATSGTAYINQDSAAATYNASISHTFILTEVVA